MGGTTADTGTGHVLVPSPERGGYQAKSDTLGLRTTDVASLILKLL